MEHSMLDFVPIAPCSATAQHWKELGPFDPFYSPSLNIYKQWWGAPSIFCSPVWTVPGLSAFPHSGDAQAPKLFCSFHKTLSYKIPFILELRRTGPITPDVTSQGPSRGGGGWPSGSYHWRQLRKVCHCSGWPGLLSSWLQWCHFGLHSPGPSV